MQTKTKSNTITFICAFLLFECSEINTTNPTDTYEYWTGMPPPRGVKVINGQYWQSAHWTKEYIMYMELVAPLDWAGEFIRMNYLTESNSAHSLPDDAPEWFNPTPNFEVFVSDAAGHESIFYLNPKNGRMLIK